MVATRLRLPTFLVGTATTVLAAVGKAPALIACTLTSLTVFLVGIGVRTTALNPNQKYCQRCQGAGNHAGAFSTAYRTCRHQPTNSAITQMSMQSNGINQCRYQCHKGKKSMLSYVIIGCNLFKQCQQHGTCQNSWCGCWYSATRVVK